jgi:hypothetical protein
LTSNNTLRTEEIKFEWMLILASAIGKVRNKNRVGFATTLYALWNSLGVPEMAINVLANLGLAKKTREQVTAERAKLAVIMRKARTVNESCVVFDNIDVSLGSRSFSKAEVEVRHRLIHVTAASVLFFQDTLVALFAQPQPRPLVLAVSALFSGPEGDHHLELTRAKKPRIIDDPLEHAIDEFARELRPSGNESDRHPTGPNILIPVTAAADIQESTSRGVAGAHK